MYTIEFTENELDLAIIQLGARLTYLKNHQKDESKKGNVARVIELEGFIKVIQTAYNKMLNTRYS